MKKNLFLGMLVFILMLGFFGCDGSNPGPGSLDQQVTRTFEAFSELLESEDPIDGMDFSLVGDTIRIDLTDVTTVYDGDTYFFEGFMETTLVLDANDDIVSGSIEMNLTASSTSLEEDIVIVLEMNIDAAETVTIITATINGDDYSENESLFNALFDDE